MATVSKPRKSTRRKPRPLTVAQKHDLAQHLSQHTGGRVMVEFEPLTYLSHEQGLIQRPSQGHIWHAGYDPEQLGIFDDGLVTEMFLDDRKGSLELQLIEELHRVANLYIEFAEMVRQSIGIAKPLAAKGGEA